MPYMVNVHKSHMCFLVSAVLKVRQVNIEQTVNQSELCAAKTDHKNQCLDQDV